MACNDFSPEAQEWLDSDPYIKFGNKPLGRGKVGQVYLIENNHDLVIKIPIGFMPADMSEDLDDMTRFSRYLLLSEIETYNRLKDLDLLTPTRAVNLGVRTAKGEEYI